VCSLVVKQLLPLDVASGDMWNAVAVQAPGVGTAARYSSSISSSQLPSIRASNPSTQATLSLPLPRQGQTLCSTNVTTSPRITTSQRQPVIVPGHAAPVFVGQFGMHQCHRCFICFMLLLID